MKTVFLRMKGALSRLIPSRRRIIQVYTALLFNAHLRGFATGKIYQGKYKGLCTPGLHCYSCPGSVGACPLGSLQNALVASQTGTPYFILGIFLLYGLLFGRFICGWLCPFGLLQDLLHKIKTPKCKKNRLTRILSYFKYVLLVLLVVVFPLVYALRDLPLPAFCKYVCPAGTLGGAIALLLPAENQDLFAMLGGLFTWKFALLLIFLTGAVFIYRFFCRFFCPLGAIYGLFNRISFVGVRVDEHACTNCGLCTAHCQMDIRRVGDHECIACGACIPTCPTQAISYKGIPLAKKAEKPRRWARPVAALVLLAVLVSSLLYFNVWGDTGPVAPPIGQAVGDTAPAADIALIGGGTVSVTETRGRVTVLNFWGTWCGPCIEELPEFDRAATDYADTATIIAIHSDSNRAAAAPYIAERYGSSRILFAQDGTGDPYCVALGGGQAWPMTVVLDAHGVIRARRVGAISYETLASLIEDAMT